MATPTKPVRVDGSIVAEAARVASTSDRSTTEQVNRWTRMGKHLDLALSGDQRRIEAVIRGEAQFSGLTTTEQQLAHAAVDAEIEARAATASFGGAARDDGLTTVAVDEDGNLVETAPDGATRRR